MRLSSATKCRCCHLFSRLQTIYYASARLKFQRLNQENISQSQFKWPFLSVPNVNSFQTATSVFSSGTQITQSIRIVMVCNVSINLLVSKCLPPSVCPHSIFLYAVCGFSIWYQKGQVTPLMNCTRPINPITGKNLHSREDSSSCLDSGCFSEFLYWSHLELKKSMSNMSTICCILHYYCINQHNVKSTIFWDIALCNPFSVNRCFGGTYRLHLQGRKYKLIKKPAWKQVASSLFSPPWR
jgi:hypothetical protein